jgi:hypothetical protein
MPKQSLLADFYILYLVADVYHFHVVGIDVNGLVTYDQLPKPSFFIMQNEKIRISYLKLVLPL